MPDPVSITVYTRADCHLCEEAIETIRSVESAVDHPVNLDLVDVDDHPDLAERYGDRVPYVLIDGTPAFKYTIDERELERRLAR